MYKQLFLEISGACNARCPWCCTGAKRSGQSGGFLSPADFQAVVHYLLEHEIIGESTLISLYNWGEPFLHPDIGSIFRILAAGKNRYSLSTNGSKAVLFEDPGLFSNLSSILFSVPGFSQASYDRIHGFQAARVRGNITAMVNNFRKCGFCGEAFLVYHDYRFNAGESGDARRFAENLGLTFTRYCAYFNGLGMYRSYLDSTMSASRRREASRDLILSHIDEQVASIPEEYACPQVEDILVIDEELNVLTCCGVEKGMDSYRIGTIFDLTLAELQSLKRSRPFCVDCMRLGLSHLVHHPHRLEDA